MTAILIIFAGIILMAGGLNIKNNYDHERDRKAYIEKYHPKYEGVEYEK